MAKEVFNVVIVNCRFVLLLYYYLLSVQAPLKYISKYLAFMALPVKKVPDPWSRDMFIHPVNEYIVYDMDYITFS